MIESTVVNIGVDVGGYGSGSAMGIVANAIIGDQIYVLHTAKYEKIDFSYSVDLLIELMQSYYYASYKNSIKVFVDESAPHYIRAAKKC